LVLPVSDVRTPMKTNGTLTLDADLLREARVVATEEGRSIGGLLTDRLEAIVRALDTLRKRAHSAPAESDTGQEPRS